MLLEAVTPQAAQLVTIAFQISSRDSPPKGTWLRALQMKESKRKMQNGQEGIQIPITGTKGACTTAALLPTVRSDKTLGNLALLNKTYPGHF